MDEKELWQKVLEGDEKSAGRLISLIERRTGVSSWTEGEIGCAREKGAAFAMSLPQR